MKQLKNKILCVFTIIVIALFNFTNVIASNSNLKHLMEEHEKNVRLGYIIIFGILSFVVIMTIKIFLNRRKKRMNAALNKE